MVRLNKSNPKPKTPIRSPPAGPPSNVEAPVIAKYLQFKITLFKTVNSRKVVSGESSFQPLLKSEGPFLYVTEGTWKGGLVDR